jgi:hypothetical protein
MRVKATVRGTGQWYSDGVEALTLDVEKSAGAPACRDGVREPIRLVIAGTEYEAALRTTATMRVVYVTRRLTAPSGRLARLATVLGESGLAKNQPVVLERSGEVWHLVP